MKNIVKGVITSIITAGILVSFKQFSYDQTNLNGMWRFETTVQKSTFQPYKDMRLKYNLLLNQDGTTISGSGERIGEFTLAEGVKTYDSEDRSNITIHGNIIKKFFGDDIIYIYFDEKYADRLTSTMLKFYYNDENMSGEYSSTVADQSGSAILSQNWY